MLLTFVNDNILFIESNNVFFESIHNTVDSADEKVKGEVSDTCLLRDESEQVLRASKLKKQVERFPNHPTHYVNIIYTCFRIKNRKIHVKGKKTCL